MTPDPHRLEHLPPGLELRPDTASRLIEAGTVRSFPARTVLWRAGSESKGLYIVIAGRVRILRARNGRQRLIHSSGPGATMGEVPLFDGGVYPATAVTALPTVCLVVTREAVLKLVRETADLGPLLLERLSARVRGLIGRLEAQSLGDVRSRLAASLLGMGAERSDGVVSVGRSQEEWAEDLGTVREVLSRELRTLKEDGAIEQIGRGTYRIVAEDVLERSTTG